MHPVLFNIGPLTVYTYGVFVFLGAAAGYFICLKLAQRQGLDKNILFDILFWGLCWGFIGARLLYILIEYRRLLEDPLSVILSRSGFVFYGGVISGLGAVYLLARKHKIKFLKLADILATAMPLAHSLGRLGCFSHGCCYGSVKGIPVQLVCSGFLFLLFCLFWFLKGKDKAYGKIASYYLIFYGAFRFVIEFYRADPRGYILFMSTSQFISLIMAASGVLLLGKLKKQVN